MNASLLVAADSSGNCHVYELKNTEELIPLQKLEAHCDYILKCLISPDVKYYIPCIFKKERWRHAQLIKQLNF